MMIMISLCLGCGPDKKKFKGYVAANYILLVVHTDLNFGAIQKIADGWREYGVSHAEDIIKIYKRNNSGMDGIDKFMGKMRKEKEADLELYMAVNDLYDVAVKVDKLKTSPAGHNLITYVSSARALRTEYDAKKARVELLLKSSE